MSSLKNEFEIVKRNRDFTGSYGWLGDEYDPKIHDDPTPADIFYLRIKDTTPVQNRGRKLLINDALAFYYTYLECCSSLIEYNPSSNSDLAIFERTNYDPLKSAFLRKQLDLIHSSELGREDFSEVYLSEYFSFEEVKQMAENIATIKFAFEMEDYRYLGCKNGANPFEKQLYNYRNYLKKPSMSHANSLEYLNRFD